MKKVKVLVVTMILATVSMVAIGQIKVGSNGYVGIGWNPIDRFTVDVGSGKINIHSWSPVYWDCSGSCSAPCLYPSQSWYQQLGKPSYRIGQIWSHDIHCTDLYESSDIRLKTNIVKLERSTLNKLTQLSAINYNMTEEAIKGVPQGLKSFYQRKQFGFSAQEVQEVFPELIHVDSNGYLGVAYSRFAPLLVEALKEQQQIINAQSLKIKELDERLAQLENGGSNDKLHKSMFAPQDSSSIDNAAILNSFLYQNTPNPFSMQTEIKYFLTEDITNATLMIFDMQGTLKKQITIQNTGQSSVVITASELQAGMYLYSLVGNGTIIDTKKMILTK